MKKVMRLTENKNRWLSITPPACKKGEKYEKEFKALFLLYGFYLTLIL